MEKEQILTNLCIYDKRHPDYDIGLENDREDVCYCDNCFYGRHQLANELLKYIVLNKGVL
jgi:hypothetical protein